MRDEYDFTNARKNPYVDKFKHVTVLLDEDMAEYFGGQASQYGVSEGTLVSQYLAALGGVKKMPDIVMADMARLSMARGVPVGDLLAEAAREYLARENG